MDYNELKRHVLAVLAKGHGMDSTFLSRELKSNGLEVDIHALRMALMRYYKQGLLKRVRSGGQYSYALTDRGVRRLEWLSVQAKTASS
jgi:DNA-binding transcriptional regulator PaaX